MSYSVIYKTTDLEYLLSRFKTKIEAEKYMNLIVYITNEFSIDEVQIIEDNK